jgi:aromatic ring-opening dioxygenase catalytic subunit (LigB family)
VRAVVFIGAHWEELDDRIRIATKQNPDKEQMDLVPPEYWQDYPINVDVTLARRVIQLLRGAGFDDVEEDPTFNWHDDTITPARWMFPEGTPPATVVSLNARYNPVFHVKIGRALRSLRKEGVLLCGTGGAVHNLYRNNWFPIITKGDNFQPGRQPARWAVEFEQSVNDVVAHNKVSLLLPSTWVLLTYICKGANLAGALIRLTKSFCYKDAHPTDDHFYPLLVVAGAVIDDDVYGRKCAQTWELQNMCNNQFVWGRWGP